MTKFVMKTMKAEPSPGAVGGVAVIIDFQEGPYPTETGEAKGLAAISAAFDAYKAKAAAVGGLMVASIGLARGEKAPPGFKKTFYGFAVINGPA